MTVTPYTLPGISMTRKWSMGAQVFQPLDFFSVLLVVTAVTPLIVGVW